MDQALQGNIGRFTLPEIFQLVANSQKTGTLGIQRDDDIVMVYFKKGKIIYGYGPRQTFHIGQILKDKGRLTDKQLEDAVRTQSKKESSKRLGQILMEKKYIDRADLEDVVRSQIEDLIYSLLSWDTGTFKFYENQYPTDEEITVNISVENAILEGCRRIDEMNRIKEALPDFGTRLTISVTPIDRHTKISLEADEWNLLSLVSGRRTISDIIEISNLPELATLNKLAALKLAGLIKETKIAKDEPEDRIKFMVNRVSGLLEQYLARKSPITGNEKTFVTEIPEPVKSRLSNEQITAGLIGDDN
ncbi:MAG: DUF4388 domain-containing protein [Candidatus Zixiibacteriota bacterium]